MPTQTYFGGATIIAPGVFSVIDDTALAAAGISASSVIGIVGGATGGKPNTALSFSTAAQAAATLRSGSLLDCVRKAFDPGGNSQGAALVIAIRAGSPTQSALTLVDAGVPTNAIVLTSLDYGAWTTQIKVKVETGTTQGKKISVAAPVAGVVQTVVQDNIYRAGLSVQYTGAAGASAMTITALQLATVNTGGVDNVTFTFAAFPTLQQMVDALNATGKYAAAVLASPTALSSTLDGVTSQDVKSAVYTANSTLQACIDFFNGQAQPFVSAAKATNALLPPANIGFTYLSAGTDGSALTLTDYTNGLAILEPQTLGIVLCDSGTASIHAAVSAHVNAMSGAAGKRERIGIVGGITGETIAQVLTRATNLGSTRMGLAWPGISDFDPNGTLTAYAPFYTAAAIAGVLSGGSVNRAATFRLIGAQSAESILKDTDVTSLLTGGVIPIQYVTGRGYRIVQSISTYTADQNFRHIELSVMRTCDAVIKSVRDNLESLVGVTTGPGLVTEATAVTDATLRLAFTNGLLVGTTTNPPYKNLQVSVTGNVLKVEFSAQVGVPANYVTITAHLSGFATA